ncbi:MAG: hypothetical protein ACOX0A_02250 [Thermoguttaceae bacterium]
MRRSICRRIGAPGLITAALVLGFAFSTSFALGQATESEAAESMGVGMKSRFASGATPITIERTEIVPGTPMSVNSTMSNILTSSSGTSFGGILSRYDTSTFGKFFGSGSLQVTPPDLSGRVDALNALDHGDNEIDNIETARMYPPRLVLDFKERPRRINAKVSDQDLKSERAMLATQIDNVLSRCDFDPTKESVRIERVDSKIYLRGKIRTPRISMLLESVMALRYGADSVVNEIEVEASSDSNVDIFGRPLE